MAKIKICLDAGHYGKYNRSSVVPAFYESDFNWKFHLLLKKYLEDYGMEVVTTRPNQAGDLDLYDRGRKAKGCDVFLSIHANWAARESADYPVCYVPINHSGDKLGLALAKCVKQVMGTKEAADVSSKKSTKGNWDWYGVIYGAATVNVPGIIIEHSFYSNKRSAEWLMIDSNLDKMAKAEADVIAAHFGVKKPAAPTQTPAPAKPIDDEIYGAVSGAYSVKDNGINKLELVRKTYPNAVLIKSGNYYKVQIEDYKTQAEANAKVAEVKSKGLDCYLSIDKDAEIIIDKPVAQPTPTKPTTVYSVHSGAFTTKKYADRKLEGTRQFYPEAVMVKVGNYYKVKIAEYTTQAEANAKVAEAKNKGLSCYISTDDESQIIINDTVASKPNPVPTQEYTLKEFVSDIQRLTGSKVDGIAGPETLGNTITVSRYVNNKHAVVKPLQKRLYAMGYTEVGEADGIAGANFEKAAKRMQKEKGRTPDGEFTKGQYSWKVVLGMV